jgi:hypothetical protein
MARVVVVPELLVLLTMTVALVFAFVIVWARECP